MTVPVPMPLLKTIVTCPRCQDLVTIYTYPGEDVDRQAPPVCPDCRTPLIADRPTDPKRSGTLVCTCGSDEYIVLAVDTPPVGKPTRLQCRRCGAEFIGRIDKVGTP